MDVRCEKCQTEYELDESRLKPGGVTVKCTNCGHMFKIRKRSSTNVGLPVADRSRPISRPPGAAPRADSVLGDSGPVRVTDQGSGPNAERQWIVRLENGETKTCRELAALQQWIIAGVATRESLISRSGKTWKRLGDIAELGQYFAIADEARAKRATRPTGPKGGAATMLGVAPAADEDLESRTTGNFRTPPPSAPPPSAPSAGAGSSPGLPKASPTAQTELATPITEPPRRPPTQPPPAPRARPAEPAGNRATAGWASAEIKPTNTMAEMPQGPRSGKLAAIPDEPAFAGRVRMVPSDEAGFQTGKVKVVDDDDELMPAQRGSRIGTWIAIFALLVIGGAAGVVYLFVFRTPPQQAAAAAKHDAGAVALAPADAARVAPPAPDAAAAPVDPLAAPRAELAADVAARLEDAAKQLAGKSDPAAEALRARLLVTLAQSIDDRAGFVAKAEGDKLRRQAKQLVIEAAPLAQRAHHGHADDPSANLAMAGVLRLQGKPAREVQRYLAAAQGKAAGDPELARSAALSAALLEARDGKLDDAQKALTAIDAPDDMRVKVELALIALAQNRPQDAQPLVDQVLATQPDHEVAKALHDKLATVVAKTDPLPPEEHGSTGSPHDGHGGHGAGSYTGGGDYDSLLARANKLALSNCSKAMEVYERALEQRPNGVEALTGMGYCHLDAKQYASAFSKFRTALVVSSRYEPALAGIAETYQQQGNKAKAIEAWHQYLAIYPGAAKAKRQLELLGATADGGGHGNAGGGHGNAGGGHGNAGGGTSTGTSDGSATEMPKPKPKPAPAPAPDPSSSPVTSPAGAGSG